MMLSWLPFQPLVSSHALLILQASEESTPYYLFHHYIANTLGGFYFHITYFGASKLLNIEQNIGAGCIEKKAVNDLSTCVLSTLRLPIIYYEWDQLFHLLKSNTILFSYIYRFTNSICPRKSFFLGFRIFRQIVKLFNWVESSLLANRVAV